MVSLFSLARHDSSTLPSLRFCRKLLSGVSIFDILKKEIEALHEDEAVGMVQFIGDGRISFWYIDSETEPCINFMKGLGGVDK